MFCKHLGLLFELRNRKTVFRNQVVHLCLNNANAVSGVSHSSKVGVWHGNFYLGGMPRLSFWLLAFASFGAFAQIEVQPLDEPLAVSGELAELRNHHFHSGIDLRTGGVTGKKVYAVADGWVWPWPPVPMKGSMSATEICDQAAEVAHSADANSRVRVIPER